MKKKLSIIVIIFVALLSPLFASAEFVLNGDITAEAADGSAPGDWKYTLHVTWDTGTQYGLSHLDLIVDDGQHCSCQAIDDAIVWDLTSGYMTSEDGTCSVDLEYELNCTGDPSIDVWAPLFKFEPVEGEGCEVGPTGEMWAVFYSNYPPGNIADENLFLVDKFARYSGFGMVSGLFPALPCDPVGVDRRSMSELKAYYR